MSTTRVTRHIGAPRSQVYAALLDPHAVARWKVPPPVTGEVDEFETDEQGWHESLDRLAALVASRPSQRSA